MNIFLVELGPLKIREIIILQQLMMLSTRQHFHFNKLIALNLS